MEGLSSVRVEPKRSNCILIFQIEDCEINDRYLLNLDRHFHSNSIYMVKVFKLTLLKRILSFLIFSKCKFQQKKSFVYIFWSSLSKSYQIAYRQSSHTNEFLLWIMRTLPIKHVFYCIYVYQFHFIGQRNTKSFSLKGSKIRGYVIRRIWQHYMISISVIFIKQTTK